VARTLDVGEHDGAVFIARELAVGEDLQTRLDRDGPIVAGERLVQRTGGWATEASFDSRCSAEVLTMISKKA